MNNSAIVSCPFRSAVNFTLPQLTVLTIFVNVEQYSHAVSRDVLSVFYYFPGWIILYNFMGIIPLTVKGSMNFD
jgi:hypothetical protein